jgi:hypothetical protein
MRRQFLLALLVGASVLVLLPVTAASAKTRTPDRHHRAVSVKVVKVKPHAIIIRVAVDRDDANLLCQSDLRTMGLRPFIVRFAMRHDVAMALARCIANRAAARSALLERASGTSTLTSTTIPAKTTTATSGTVSVPASASLQGTITGGRPLATGTAAVALSADWSQRHTNGVAGELCAPATGTATFTGSTAKSAAVAPASGTITMSLTGTLCAHAGTTSVPSAAGSSSSFFAGNYSITSATGVTTATTAAAGSVVGHGRIAVSIQPNGMTKLVAVGGLHS